MSSRWTTADIPDQTGRRAIVTGSNSGIGFPAALELARHGAAVVVASRDRAKGEAAAARINQAVGHPRAEFSQLDLASLASVRAFADRELARDAPLDLLINNAGIGGLRKRRETSDGFELQFGTNVLGHFALTALLLPALNRTPATHPGAPAQSQPAAPTPPRVVWIASIAHKRGQLNFNDLQYRAHYSHSEAYSQSKLADLMLSFELDRRLRAGGSRIRSLAAHPGVAYSNIFQAGSLNTTDRIVRTAIANAVGALLNSTEQGALPTLYAATSTEAQPGGYYGPQGFGEMRGGDVGPAKVATQARDGGAAARLWQICEDLTGAKIP